MNNKRNKMFFVATAVLFVSICILWNFLPNQAEDQDNSKEDTKYANTPSSFKLSDDQILRSEIVVETVKQRMIRTVLNVPGKISFNSNKTVHIVSQVSGVAKDVKVNEGDQVKAGDVLAVFESRELANAKASCLTAHEKEKLYLEEFNREEKLWEKKISSEQDYLEAKNKFAESRIEFNSTKQSLLTLGLSESDVTALVTGKQKMLTRYEIKSPIAGVVVKKNISNGELIATDTDAFFIADLSIVWVDMAIHADQVKHTKIGQKVFIRSEAMDQEANGTLFYISPILDNETKTVVARVAIQNKNGVWRPGLFVTASVIIDETKAPETISKDAIQVISGVSVVFVRTGNDFAIKRVKLGRSDGQYVEVQEGVLQGETYVTENSFVLKAHVLNMESE